MKKLFFVFIFSQGFLMQFYAQTINDAGLWTTINIEKKINKKIGFFLTEEFRLKENFSEINLFYTNFGCEVEPLKFLKLAFTYRLTEKFTKDHTISYRHRLMLDVFLKEKLGNFEFSYRQRIQEEVKDVYSSEMGSIPEWFSRNKLTMKYDFDKPIKPYVSLEIRYQITDPNLVESNKLFHRNRYVAGIDYKVKDKHTFGIYYLIQREYNVSNRENDFIIGLEYGLSL